MSFWINFEMDYQRNKKSAKGIFKTIWRKLPNSQRGCPLFSRNFRRPLRSCVPLFNRGPSHLNVCKKKTIALLNKFPDITQAYSKEKPKEIFEIKCLRNKKNCRKQWLSTQKNCGEIFFKKKWGFLRQFLWNFFWDVLKNFLCFLFGKSFSYSFEVSFSYFI